MSPNDAASVVAEIRSDHKGFASLHENAHFESVNTSAGTYLQKLLPTEKSRNLSAEIINAMEIDPVNKHHNSHTPTLGKRCCKCRASNKTSCSKEGLQMFFIPYPV
jgi:hypothetical protein